MPSPAIKTDFPFWQLPVTELLEQLDARLDGLSSAEAALRLKRFGSNIIYGEHKKAPILQFLAKFRNPLVIILLVASALSAFTGDATSFFIIATIVLINVTPDFVQEYRAGLAAEGLRQSVAVRGQVKRDGKIIEIPLAEMVRGDVALLAAGDLIPCDGRVMESKDFFVNQALLTGEAFPEDILRLSVSYEGYEEAELRPLDDTARVSINGQFETLSKEGFRVLGIVSRKVGMDHPHAVVSDESELVFVDFAAFLAPQGERQGGPGRTCRRPGCCQDHHRRQ